MKPISLTNKAQKNSDKKLQRILQQAGEIPRHIAIIMDGNGRWAKRKGNLRKYGHKAGVDSVREIAEACGQLGVKYLTLYTFSTENWNRPKTEVNALMHIMVNALSKEADNMNQNNMKLETIGQTNRFPRKCRQKLNEVINLTKNNDGLHLCLALSYSGRWDITEAVKKLSREVQKGTLDPEDIDDRLIDSHLSTVNIPDPDLIIRTSGEYRISNFLLWQLAYSELYMTETYWPDFRRDELYRAISSYQKRDRRYGSLKAENKNNSLGSYVKELIS